MLPMAMTVAGEEPDMAAKKIQAITEAMARPPLNLPTKSFMTFTRRSDMAPSAMMFPARIKKGTPSKTKLSSPLNNCCIRDVRGVWAIKKRYMAVVETRTMEMGMLKVRRPKKHKNRRVRFKKPPFFLPLDTVH